jgi:predicted transporter
MELKSLFLGLAFSVGIFAVKAGAGLAYYLDTRPGYRHRILASAAVAAGYGLVFLLAWAAIQRLDPALWLNRVLPVLQHGMTLHLVLAVLLLVWGAALLKQPPEPTGPTRGWLLLTLPCPVCFTVIFFSLALLYALLPEQPRVPVWAAAGFIGTVLAAGWIGHGFIRQPSRHFLGGVMVLAALYFLITMAVVPWFSDIERIYRLGKTGIHEPPGRDDLMFRAGAMVLFAGGFMHALRRSRRSKWK